MLLLGTSPFLRAGGGLGDRARAGKDGRGQWGGLHPVCFTHLHYLFCYCRINVFSAPPLRLSFLHPNTRVTVNSTGEGGPLALRWAFRLLFSKRSFLPASWSLRRRSVFLPRRCWAWHCDLFGSMMARGSKWQCAGSEPGLWGESHSHTCPCWSFTLDPTINTHLCFRRTLEH